MAVQPNHNPPIYKLGADLVQMCERRRLYMCLCVHVLYMLSEDSRTIVIRRQHLVLNSFSLILPNSPTETIYRRNKLILFACYLKFHQVN